MVAVLGRFRSTRARDATLDIGPTADPAASAAAGEATLDFGDSYKWPAGFDAAELRARMRADQERTEALHELLRLRTRYWSGERIIEEAKADLAWWEHPEADPYAVLELLPGASLDEAAAARRAIARACHPDLTHTQGKALDLSLRRMVAANAAYERLRRALRPSLDD